MLGLTISAILMWMPPPPPPPADAWAAAVALWNEHPVPPEEKRFAINSAVSIAASRAAGAAFLKPNAHHGMRAIRMFSDASTALQPLIARQVPTDQSGLDAEVARCATMSLAYSFSVSDLAEIGRFAATPVGARFWHHYVGFDPNLELCYRNVLKLRASDADLRAVGIDPSRVDPGQR
ncbi:hypothetical protein [uncultured Sphingomonas sp.]|uniref:hypothetical protein n=1 Tax=uncultured Sphingomonas sp. TaxID=158754 RepID=UPI0035CC58AB